MITSTAYDALSFCAQTTFLVAIAVLGRRCRFDGDCDVALAAKLAKSDAEARYFTRGFCELRERGFVVERDNHAEFVSQGKLPHHVTLHLERVEKRRIVTLVMPYGRGSR